ncbi:hypothetical protein [Methylotenera versatilis]|jgi:hypothetical protein|uniref:Uncharacterized protein n=1 Tax=Methylotenera versatilis (strain 301) TaxID=666681 RepID=D7DJU6_METV0|nr:hypothetical protein [Methylotenera versatilis]ADI30307.1 conserved hypothetical protein [Methylotenera versatilis 301]
MSKINQLQAAALKAPVEKTTPVKAVVKKAVTQKPVVAKAAPTKVAAAKTAVAAPKAVAPKVVKAKPVAKEKAPKLKMERDSFTMPKAEYAQLYVLKERLAKLGNPAKKSELLRAGIMQLTAMTDAALKVAMSKVPTIKTGRPKKK